MLGAAVDLLISETLENFINTDEAWTGARDTDPVVQGKDNELYASEAYCLPTGHHTYGKPTIEAVKDDKYKDLQEVKLNYACITNDDNDSTKVLQHVYLNPKDNQPRKKRFRGVTRLKNPPESKIMIFTEKRRENIKAGDINQQGDKDIGFSRFSKRRKLWGDYTLEKDATDADGRLIARAGNSKYVNHLLEKVEITEDKQRSRIHVTAATEYIPLIINKIGFNPKYYRKDALEMRSDAANKHQNMIKLQTNLYNRTGFGWMMAAYYYHTTGNNVMLAHVMTKIRDMIETIPYVANRIAQTLGAGQKFDVNKCKWTSAEACLSKLINDENIYIIPEDPMQLDLGSNELNKMRSFCFKQEIFISE